MNDVLRLTGKHRDAGHQSVLPVDRAEGKGSTRRDQLVGVRIGVVAVGDPAAIDPATVAGTGMGEAQLHDPPTRVDVVGKVVAERDRVVEGRRARHHDEAVEIRDSEGERSRRAVEENDLTHTWQRLQRVP